ncbi:MAG: ATPase, T2SS/T4P/T4SS family [Deltaproteobacteria bacterium]|nr:ATPase, T2SS/T4P/T4SS family [Deltaproteobacteria bacterium]
MRKTAAKSKDTPPAQSLPPQEPALTEPLAQPLEPPAPQPESQVLPPEPLPPSAAIPVVSASPPVSGLLAHPLVRILVESSHVRAEDLAAIAPLVEKGGGSLPALKKALLAQKVVTEDGLQQAVARLFGLEYIPHLDEMELLRECAKEIPIRYAKKFVFFPIGLTDREVRMAVADPENDQPLEDVARRMGRRLEMVVSTHLSILSLINRAYERAESDAGQSIEGIETPEGAEGSGVWGIEEPEDLIDARDEEPIKRLLNNILYQASRSQTSDVHIDSNNSEVVVRFRVDGVLQTVATLPKAIHLTLINRIKILSRLDISQRSLPQDGRTPLLIAGRKIDVRVSTMPTVNGEKAVMRLLYQDQDMFSLPSLGMPKDIWTSLKKLIRSTGGIILVSGPTGSGKTTTLYAALGEIDRHAKNIMTIEDPVEYKIAGYVQTEVNPKLGLTFANALRSVLRQDPDIIMVGEMRDRETALIAIQAALTGHTVFSTVHTNDAPSTVTRLVDMGIEPYLVSSTVMAVLAQRLLRRICSHCKTPVEPDEALLMEAGLNAREIKAVKTLYKGAGCSHCRGTGYSGRVGVFELLVMSDQVKKVLAQTNESSLLRDAATASGMVSMRQYGLKLVEEGITTAEELVQTTRDD